MKIDEIKEGMIVKGKSWTGKEIPGQHTVCFDPLHKRFFVWNAEEHQDNPLARYATWIASAERSWIDERLAETLTLIDQKAPAEPPTLPPPTTRLEKMAATITEPAAHRGFWTEVYYAGGLQQFEELITSLNRLIYLTQARPEMLILALSCAPPMADDFPLERALHEGTEAIKAGYAFGQQLKAEKDQLLKEQQPSEAGYLN